MSRTTVVTYSLGLETETAERFFPVRGELDVKSGCILSVWVLLLRIYGRHPVYSLLAISEQELSICSVY